MCRFPGRNGAAFAAPHGTGPASEGVTSAGAAEPKEAVTGSAAVTDVAVDGTAAQDAAYPSAREVVAYFQKRHPRLGAPADSGEQLLMSEVRLPLYPAPTHLLAQRHACPHLPQSFWVTTCHSFIFSLRLLQFYPVMEATVSNPAYCVSAFLIHHLVTLLKCQSPKLDDDLVRLRSFSNLSQQRLFIVTGVSKG